MKHRLTVRHSVRAVVSDLSISYGEILEGFYTKHKYCL